MLGDGIGPEIVPASVRVVDAALAAAGAEPVDWQELPLGASAIEEHGSAIPPATMEALADLDGWLLGPHDSAAYPEPFRSQLNPSGAIRKHFDLYANIRPARGFEGGTAIAPGHRPGDRPGEHRGLLRRPQHLRRHGGVHADGGRRDLPGRLHPAGGRADRPDRVRAGPAPAEQGDDRAQGERAAAELRAVQAGLPRGGRGLSRRRGGRLPHRRDDGAPAAPGVVLRRRRRREHVRRHPVRHGR